MGRSRTKKTSFLDELYKFLEIAPFWVGPLVAVGVFAFLRWLVPWWLAPTDPKDLMAKTVFSILGRASEAGAPWATGVVVLIWVIAEARKWSNRERLNRQSGIESIRDLSWREFEQLLAEAFGRLDYTVEQVGGAAPDGGVDLRLRRPGEIVLVQCKQWKAWKVGVKVVRELYGVVASQRAATGIVVASGEFTAEAIEFARQVGIRLIGGDELARMILQVQDPEQTPKDMRPPASHADTAQVLITRPSPTQPVCPTCGATMTLRTAKKGTNVGSQFWGCSRYPICRSTRPLSANRA